MSRGRCGQQDVTQQPAGMNKEGGSRMDARVGCAMKGDARRRRRYNRQRDNQPANRGKREEMRQRTSGGGALIAEVAAEAESRGREAGDNHGDGEGEGDGDGDRKCRAAAITGLGECPPRSSRLRLWMRSTRRRWRPWSLRLRLRPRSRQTTPMTATTALPSLVARLLRRGAG